MKHLVLIRFNTGNKDASWLDHRLKFFRAFTAPSLRSQTNQNFTTVFLVDSSTPPSIVQELEDIGLIYKIDSGQKYSVRDWDFKRFLREQSPKDVCVITSRLDSDDGFARKYIEHTQSVITDINEFIIYNSGVVWTEGRFFLKTEVAPPFLSRVEYGRKLVPPDTVYGIKTHERALNAPHQIYSDAPMWLMACHNRNLLNEPGKLGRELPLEEVQQHFEVDMSWLA